MDQDTAQQLLKEGGTFIAFDVPPDTEFGIDMKQWITGDKFKGVKMIPPGIHFIHYSAVGKYGQVAPRVGFFHNFKKSEFVVSRWNKDAEELRLAPVDEQEINTMRDNIKELDRFLGPYPYDIWEKWVLLTSNITDSLLQKLTPALGQVRSALDLESCSDADRPRKNVRSSMDDEPLTSDESVNLNTSTKHMESLLPDLKPFPGTELRLTSFPKLHYPEGSTPAQITQHSLDSSYVLDEMVAQHTRDIDIIGELEFAYICFLAGNSFEAFEHWRKLVTLLCSCDIAIRKYRILYDLFITTIEMQIIQTPEEFFADIVSNNNVVYLKLRQLFRTVECGGADGRLKTKVQRCKESLTDKFSWDFSHLDSEDEDEAPVVVEIS